MYNMLRCEPVEKVETYSIAQFQPLNEYLNYNNNSNGNEYCTQISEDLHCSLKSSSLSFNNAIYNSPTTVSFSPSQSSLIQQESHSLTSDLNHSPNTNYGSPISGSYGTEDVNDLKKKLKELETEMLGPDLDILEAYNDVLLCGIASEEIDSWRKMMVAIPRGDLKQVLIACAKAVSNNDLLMAQWLMSELRQIVSVSGEPIQRLGAYMLEGLISRVSASGSSIYKSLKCKEPASIELLSYMHILYEVCPCFKFGHVSANGAIAEAMKDEQWIHIIDFQIGQGIQWISLIKAFAARPGGPPHIRMTGIDDITSAYARGGGLNIVGEKLSKLADTFKVPFEFHAAVMSDCEAQLKSIGIRPGEALAVNFAFMLHHMPDENAGTKNHQDQLLSTVKNLNPKVVTLVEQELNTNTASFYPRFLEALDYYTAMFESIDASLPREHKNRINVEQHCLAREVINIIACEETERVARHELVEKWRSRFKMAGFSPYPLSSVVNTTIKTLLENHSIKYRVEERDGALYIGWLDRDLVASCAWK